MLTDPAAPIQAQFCQFFDSQKATLESTKKQQKTRTPTFYPRENMDTHFLSHNAID
jgi:hypothetical protein